MKTLLVDDEEDLRQLFTRMLSDRCDVRSFETGEAAWEACKNESFELAILDWMLPGMSGLDLCRKLRSTPGGSRMLIVVLTGRSGPEDLAEVLAAGADDYWTKPIDV